MCAVGHFCWCSCSRRSRSLVIPRWTIRLPFSMWYLLVSRLAAIPGPPPHMVSVALFYPVSWVSTTERCQLVGVVANPFLEDALHRAVGPERPLVLFLAVLLSPATPVVGLLSLVATLGNRCQPAAVPGTRPTTGRATSPVLLPRRPLGIPPAWGAFLSSLTGTCYRCTLRP